MLCFLLGLRWSNVISMTWSPKRIGKEKLDGNEKSSRINFRLLFYRACIKFVADSFIFAHHHFQRCYSVIPSSDPFHNLFFCSWYMRRQKVNIWEDSCSCKVNGCGNKSVQLAGIENRLEPSFFLFPYIASSTIFWQISASSSIMWAKMTTNQLSVIE